MSGAQQPTVFGTFTQVGAACGDKKNVNSRRVRARAKSGVRRTRYRQAPGVPPRGARRTVGGHGRVAGEPEPPGPVGAPRRPTRGPVDTVPRAAGHARGHRTGRRSVAAVVEPDAQRLAEPGRAAGQVAVAPLRGRRCACAVSRPSTTSPARSSTALRPPSGPRDDVGAARACRR